ncbi:hypothetical protein [Streptomyces sp. NPDC002851]
MPGATLCGEPQTITADGHPAAGTRWVYGLTPWGMQMELYAAAP